MCFRIRLVCYWEYSSVTVLYAVNGEEGGLKMQDVKTTDQVARHENAGLEIVTHFSSIIIIVIINVVVHYSQKYI